MQNRINHAQKPYNAHFGIGLKAAFSTRETAVNMTIAGTSSRRNPLVSSNPSLRGFSLC